MIDLIAVDTNDGPIFLPRVAAHALASGGVFDPITEHVVGGDPSMTMPEYDKPTADEVRRVVMALRENGFVVVPIEPTEEMINAGWIDKEDVNPDDIYRAMLAAASTSTP